MTRHVNRTQTMFLNGVRKVIAVNKITLNVLGLLFFFNFKRNRTYVWSGNNLVVKRHLGRSCHIYVCFIIVKIRIQKETVTIAEFYGSVTLRFIQSSAEVRI